MRAFIPQISWHNRLPALSLDILKIPDEESKYRVATGGYDCRVYIWIIDTAQEDPDIRIVAGLRRHQKSVGVVRFSSQHLLASGDDEGYIFIWKYNSELAEQKSNTFLDDDGFEDLEVWQQKKVLRGHLNDVCDLAWSKDGQFLLSGSVDNSIILWDPEKGSRIWWTDSFKGYVHGVAIDPNTQFMAAFSSDGTLRVYNFIDHRLLCTTRRMDIKRQFEAFFCGDRVKTFCRRLEFSPDGQFLLAPTSRLLEKDGQKNASNIVLVFKRNTFNKPSHYYITKELALCIRFSPVLYKLRSTETNFWDIPYRMVFAIATSQSVLIYDSQQSSPIGYASQIHLARLTDLAWSSDGRLLMVSSYDGYITLLSFEEGEFGEIYTGPVLKSIGEKKCKNEPVTPKISNWILRNPPKKARIE